MSYARSTSRNGLLPTSTTSTTLRYSIDADVIKCPLCDDVFESPRVLPCGHSACFTCLDSLTLKKTDSSKSKTFFLCPVCKRKTKPTGSQLMQQRYSTQYPINYVILRLLRNASVENTEDNDSHKAFCEICLANSKTRPVVAKCTNCEEHYCNVCYMHHERREDTRGHHLVFYVAREEIGPAENKRRLPRNISHKHRAVSARDEEKHVTRLCVFSGKLLEDTTTCDFRGGTFLTDDRIVLSDFANKKLKVFDVTHKSRVELICDLVLRVDPTQVCRVDANTVALLTERSGSYHIKLFIIGENIRHLAHRSLDMTPLGIGYLRNTIVCSFLETNVLKKYRLSRAQQIQTGEIKQDIHGDDLFHQPGIICQGEVHGMPALYVVDEAENGIDVTSITLNGEKRHSVFLECTTRKRRNVHSGKRSIRTPPKTDKLGRIQSSRPYRKRDELDASESNVENVEASDIDKVRDANRPPTRPSTPEPILGDHKARHVGFRTPSDEAIGSADGAPRSQYIHREGVESYMERDGDIQNKRMDEVVPKQPNENIVDNFSQNHTSSSPPNVEYVRSTQNGNPTKGTAGGSILRRPTHRAASAAVDRDGNVYVCMYGSNKVVRVTASGQHKTDLLTEEDGLVAPNVASVSPSNGVLFVTCAGSNRVMMFKMK